jgi:hypothetical protein
MAVDFDGTDDYYLRSGDLSTLSNGGTGTAFGWVRLDGGDASTMYLLSNENQDFFIIRHE